MNTIKLIKRLLKHPFSILQHGAIVIEEEKFKKSISKKYNIEQLPTVDLMELFPNFNENLSTYSFLEGTSLITDLMILKQFARTYPACKYLEIGSWRGESLKNVSEVAESCVAITLSPKEMKNMHYSQEVINVHGVFSKGTNNITEILHNSKTYDFNKLKNKFDLIFIDGDHSYEGVLNDTKKTFNLRKNDSSVIVWHDYGISTERVTPSVLAAILDGIPHEKHNNLFHVSNTLCAIYIENRKFKTYQTKYPTYPNKKFSISVSAHIFK